MYIYICLYIYIYIGCAVAKTRRAGVSGAVAVEKGVSGVRECPDVEAFLVRSEVAPMRPYDTAAVASLSWLPWRNFWQGQSSQAQVVRGRRLDRGRPQEGNASAARMHQDCKFSGHSQQELQNRTKGLESGAAMVIRKRSRLRPPIG